MLKGVTIVLLVDNSKEKVFIFKLFKKLIMKLYLLIYLQFII
jgi:hypothetical protein